MNASQRYARDRDAYIDRVLIENDLSEKFRTPFTRTYDVLVVAEAALAIVGSVMLAKFGIRRARNRKS